MTKDKKVTATKLKTMEQVQEALGVLAAEVVRLSEGQAATATLVQKMHGRVKLLTRLLDHLHAILERHGLVPPRPKEGFDVN